MKRTRKTNELSSCCGAPVYYREITDGDYKESNPYCSKCKQRPNSVGIKESVGISTK